MSRVVFLLEEYSMKVLLDGLLPRLFPGLPFLCVPHEGKHDFERSMLKERFRDPDAIDQPARALAGMVAEFQKASGARRMAQALTRENRSRSFQVLISGIDGLAPEIHRGDIPAGAK